MPFIYIRKGCPMLTKVTFTGIDEKTDVQELLKLAHEYPFLEFGILVHLKPTQNENRFTGIKLLNELQAKGLNLSCHVCGQLTKEIVTKNNWELLYDLLGDHLNLFQRIQLNASRLTKLSSEFQPPKAHQIIVQVGSNDILWEQLKHQENMVRLHDLSGGKGVYSENWPQTDEVFFGYAGGISRLNVVHTLNVLKDINPNNYWIDMEQSLRTPDDWFDLVTCRRIAELCAPYISI